MLPKLGCTKDKESGFTLIELLVVIAIIAMLAALTAAGRVPVMATPVPSFMVLVLVAARARQA